jgi:hypothetical protein
MPGQLLRRSVIVAVALAVVGGVWSLPRAVSSDASTPPASIELHSEPTPTASPEADTQARPVDDHRDEADDGHGTRTRKRAERRTSRESVPDTTSARQAGDDDDDGNGGDGDGDDGGDDDDGDDDLDDDDD